MSSDIVEQPAAEKSSAVAVDRRPPSDYHWLCNWSLFAGLLPLLGLIPMLAIHAIGMSQRTYMVFVPLVLLIVGIFAFRRNRDALCKNPHRLRVAFFALMASVAIALFSVWDYSPMLAHIAAVGVFFAWGLGRWGGVAWSHVAAVTLLLATTLPWPSGLDYAFGSWLNLQSAGYAAAVLDAFSVPNLMTDNTLRTEFTNIEFSELGKYTSVFALIALGGLLALILHRSFSHALLLVLTAPIWFVASLSLVMLAFVYLQRELTNAHEWSWFLLAVLTLVLFDQFLGSMLKPVPLTEPEFGPLFFVVNRAMCWPHEDVLEDTPPDDPEELAIYEQIMRQKPQPVEQPEVNWFDLKHAKWLVGVPAVLALLSAVAPAILLAKGNVARTAARFRPVPESELATFANVELGSPSGLPRQLQAWIGVAYKAMPTDEDQPAGFEWQYNWRGQVVTANVTFPHAKWNGRVEVSKERDWSRLVENIVQLPQSEWFLGFAEFENPFGGRSYVVQSAMNDALAPVSLDADERIAKLESERPPIMRMLSPQTSGDDRIFYRLTAVCETGVSLSEKEQLEFQRCFELFCNAVKTKLNAGKLQGLAL